MSPTAIYPCNLITNIARKALEEVATWLELGAPKGYKGVEYFSMAEWIIDNWRPNTNAECGTVCCIAGALIKFNALDASKLNLNTPIARFLEIPAETLSELFIPHIEYFDYTVEGSLRDITPAHAARTIRHFLETGHVDWNETLIEEEYKHLNPV